MEKNDENEKKETRLECVCEREKRKIKTADRRSPRRRRRRSRDGRTGRSGGGPTISGRRFPEYFNYNAGVPRSGTCGTEGRVATGTHCNVSGPRTVRRGGGTAAVYGTLKSL